jgi:hypothetical protein
MDRTREAQAALTPRTRSSDAGAGAGLDLLQLVARNTARSPPRAARRSDESCHFTASSSRNDLAPASVTDTTETVPDTTSPPPRATGSAGNRTGHDLTYWQSGNCPGLV